MAKVKRQATQAEKEAMAHTPKMTQGVIGEKPVGKQVPTYIFESGKYQLVLKDGEVGTTQIVARSNSAQQLAVKALSFVSADNNQNALTEDQANDSWNSYFVEAVKLNKEQDPASISTEEVIKLKAQPKIIYSECLLVDYRLILSREMVLIIQYIKIIM